MRSGQARLLMACILGGMAMATLGCPSCGGGEAPAPPLKPRPGLDGQRAYKLLERIVACGPRYPGSQGAAKMRRILQEELKSMGVAAETQTFPREIRGRRTPLVNLWARLPGERADEIILIGTHYDTKIMHGHPDPAHNFEFQGANDGGSGTVVLVELARMLKERERRCTYWFVWFDGEESVPFHWDDRHSLFGSTHFASRLEARGDQGKVKAMILLDIIGYPGLRTDDDTLSDPRLKRIFKEAAARLGLAHHFFQGPPFEVKDDHVPFVALGIPAVNLIGLSQLTDRDIWHTPRDTIDRVSPASLALVGDVTLEALPAVEKL